MINVLLFLSSSTRLDFSFSSPWDGDHCVDTPNGSHRETATFFFLFGAICFERSRRKKARILSNGALMSDLHHALDFAV